MLPATITPLPPPCVQFPGLSGLQKVMVKQNLRAVRAVNNRPAREGSEDGGPSGCSASYNRPQWEWVHCFWKTKTNPHNRAGDLSSHESLLQAFQSPPRVEQPWQPQWDRMCPVRKCRLHSLLATFLSQITDAVLALWNASIKLPEQARKFVQMLQFNGFFSFSKVRKGTPYVLLKS
jgi:hypothetical protein